MRSKLAFWSHLFFALALVAGPLWSLNAAVGIVAAIACVAAIEVAHGWFDDLFDLFEEGLNPRIDDGR